MAKDKFAAHRVLERVGYGVGVRLQLTASQIADRRHALGVDDEKAGIITVTEPIEFRAGEEIGIAHTLTRHEETALEPVDKATRKPKTSVPLSKLAPTADADQGAGDSANANDEDTDDEDADGAEGSAEDEGSGEAGGNDAGGE